ncbi:MAG TPA: Rieske (2Fe-2S) protein [Gaiellaceae bacterium]|nr:Rieske (2Fe-2S) protein [Gaiellaceae bacterium]
MTRLKDWLIALGALALGAGSAPPREPRRRIVPPGTKQRRAESLVLGLFAGVMLASLAFILVYAIDAIGHRTQWLALSLGLALAFLTLACVVFARRLVVTEELAHPYPADGDDPEIAQIVQESGSRLTRKKLVLLAGGGALGMLGLAAVTPTLSLGPALNTEELARTPWRKGRRLVGEDGRPLAARDVEPGSFHTAYPEGADRELIGSPVVVVRIRSGVVAYSKICTHAGCAVALYRKPKFPDVQPRPALVCPCHYSTFDPAQNGKVLFGPAGRPLPRLPLEVDAEGNLRAAGNFNGPVGPSWWGVRDRKAT